MRFLQTPPRCLFLLPAIAFSALCSAQKGADLVLCDSTHDQLVRLTDVDGDSDYNSANEVLVLYTDGTGGLNQSLPRSAEARVEGDTALVYWLDAAADAVWRGLDSNFNGLIEANEASKYRDIALLDGPASPDGLELMPDSSIWWCSDIFGAPANGLLRLFDRNGDGDCNDVAEQAVMLNGSQQLNAESDIGPVPLDSSAFKRMTRSGKGVVLFSGGDSEAFYRVEDLNADNDLADPGELRLFLAATAKNSALPQNPDFASGALPSLQVSKTTGLEWARMSQISSRLEGAAWVYYLATDVGANGPQARNVANQGINGLVFRGFDANLDGDINDAGEVTLFYDGSVTSATAVRIDRVSGIDVKADEIYLADAGFGSSAVHRLQDKNLDFDALDPGEVQGKRFDFATYGGGPAFFFGNPFFEDLAVVPTNTFGGNWQVTGTGCAVGGIAPKISFSGAAKLGTSSTLVQLSQAASNATAYLFFGTSTQTYQGSPLPLDLKSMGLSGCTLYQDLAVFKAVTVSAAGTGSYSLTIPNSAQLDGEFLAMQWVVLDTKVFPSELSLSALGELLLTD